MICAHFSSEELSDVERLKRIFRGYFLDHETFSTVKREEIHMLVEERAQACAAKYREKLRRLHLSHTDYYLDTLHRLSVEENPTSEQLPTTAVITRTTYSHTIDGQGEQHDMDEKFFSISVV